MPDGWLVDVLLFVVCLCLAWQRVADRRRIAMLEAEARHLRGVLLRFVPAEQLMPREARPAVPGVARLSIVSGDRS